MGRVWVSQSQRNKGLGVDIWKLLSQFSCASRNRDPSQVASGGAGRSRKAPRLSPGPRQVQAVGHQEQLDQRWLLSSQGSPLDGSRGVTSGFLVTGLCSPSFPMLEVVPASTCYPLDLVGLRGGGALVSLWKPPLRRSGLEGWQKAALPSGGHGGQGRWNLWCFRKVGLL